MNDELSLAELDGEFCEKLPVRNQMRMHRGFGRRRSFRHFNSCGCSCGGFNTFGFRGGFNRGFDGGFNRGFDGGFGGGFGGFGGGFGGSAFNSNRTFQGNFNPQFAFGGGGGISSFNSNANFTNQNAFGFNGF